MATKLDSTAITAITTASATSNILPKATTDPQSLTQTTTPTTAATTAHSTIPTKAATSVNFRLSQLSDSGAESGDGDDQTRLLRSTSSCKFIIIPSTPPNSGASTPTPIFSQLPSAASTSSLAALLKATSLKQTPTSICELPSSSVNSKSNAKSLTPHVTVASSIPTRVGTINGTVPVSSQSVISPTNYLQYFSPSDVIHQSNATSVTFSTPIATITQPSVTTVTTTTTTTPTTSSVKFTIEDYCDSPDPPINSINSAAVASLTPTYSTEFVGSPLSATRSHLEVPLRQRHNSSVRSVVSAYIPGSTDTINESPHLLKPNSYLDVKDLSASSSYIYRDHMANQIYSDVTSVRSLASIGIGSTDGRKLVIRRVPHTPDELFSMVHSPKQGLPNVNDIDDDSYLAVSDDLNNLKPRKQHWANKMQFVLACIGYSVGLGNVWRFPYMCYKSGGGVFLVPYCIILFICSIPLLFMELSVGQYTGRGPIGALGQLCPLFKGAGLASVVVSFLMSTYYSVIIGYSIYYFFTSFRSHMPWVDCSNRWNTPDCWVPQRKEINMTAPITSRTPSEEFFENKVLQISPGIEYPGMMRWELFACLICAWLMVYFATWKSIKSSAKVRYFTATFPFILIIILMGRAVTLDGADAGLRYFFRPNWSELAHANVWINAASQNFNSLGITFGSMISFASYNKYNNNILRDAVAVSVVNILTSLLVGVFAFATLGNLALEQNTNVRDVIGDGPGLIFVVYPQAMAKMPYAQLWAVMFFFMLLCLGLNSQFAIVEVVVTSIQDGFPNWIKRHLGYHEIVVFFVCLISFLFGLPNLIQGGIYYFQLMDHYAASVSIMFLSFCQMIAIAWFYGTGRLSKNVKQMTGKAPSLYLKSCWLVLGPCLLFAIWVLSLINYREPSYHNGRYKYPEWAYGIGWMFASFSLVCIPGYAIVNILRSPGDTLIQRIRNTLRPNIYECKICGEHHCEHDFPEQEQYMLEHEMYNVYKPTNQVSGESPLNYNANQKTCYSPMQLQNQHTEFAENDASVR